MKISFAAYAAIMCMMVDIDQLDSKVQLQIMKRSAQLKYVIFHFLSIELLDIEIFVAVKWLRIQRPCKKIFLALWTPPSLPNHFQRQQLFRDVKLQQTT